MKKIYYLLAFLAIGITACQKQPIVGVGGSGSNEVKALNITLAATDYTTLGSSVYPYKTKSFNSDADANTYIPMILNNRYPQLSNGSTANITFSEQPVLADSVFKDQQYTLITAPTNDYKLLPNNTFSDFSIAQTLAWLPYKFPNAVQAQQEILTFAYYNGQATVTSTFAFLYTNGAWVQAYLLTANDYIAVGHPAFSQFVTADEASIPSLLNAVLKSNPAIMTTAKAGTQQYVSFNFYITATKVTTQRVFLMVYDGANWSKNATSTLTFLKSGGTWIADPTVRYTITTADIALLNGTSVNTATPIANVIQYGDFNIVSGSQYYWSTSQLQAAMIVILTHDFPSPKVNVPYKVSYLAYTGTDATASLTFIFNGTAWIAQ